MVRISRIQEIITYEQDNLKSLKEELATLKRKWIKLKRDYDLIEFLEQFLILREEELIKLKKYLKDSK